jgi:hypothetical protein
MGDTPPAAGCWPGSCGTGADATVTPCRRGPPRKRVPRRELYRCSNIPSRPVWRPGRGLGRVGQCHEREDLECA